MMRSMILKLIALNGRVEREVGTLYGRLLQ